MAHQFTFGPDPGEPDWSTADGRLEGASSSASAEELDLAELRAKFNAYGGGVTPEMSADLALEIVLNEVVEQACLATGASGAAIALERDGEWICRASAGSNAPQLGARLDAETGLSVACVITREVQRCDDAQNDPRVDAEACRELGVSSVIVFPLLLKGELSGIFELFSKSRSAFGERDERTLEALSQRVLRILEHRSDPIMTSESAAEAAPAMAESSIAERGSIGSEPDYILPGFAQNRRNENGYGRGFQFLTWVLGAAVLASFAFLTVIFVQRVVGRKAVVRAPSIPSSAVAKVESGSAIAPSKVAETTSGGAIAGLGVRGVLPADSGSAKEAWPPTGGLLVYENGKEIFRTPSVGNPAAGHAPPAAAPIMERAGIYELSPEAAEGSLIHRVEPDYPEEARLQQIQGAVVLELRAAADGTVQEVNLISGPPLLTDAAIAAVKQWRFKSRTEQGKPVGTQMKVTLNFKLPATLQR